MRGSLLPATFLAKNRGKSRQKAREREPGFALSCEICFSLGQSVTVTSTLRSAPGTSLPLAS